MLELAISTDIPHYSRYKELALTTTRPPDRYTTGDTSDQQWQQQGPMS